MAVAGHNQNTYKDVQAINPDYRNTGFDRGHLNPSSYQCDHAREATFTLTKAVPQDPCFNEQIWRKMEEKSKEVMKMYCSFPEAKRYFVTGAIPRNRMIPNEEHDVEYDPDPPRTYNRVSVPSHMWTAACCDSSEASEADRDKGFSFAYYGENKPESSATVTTVRVLEITIKPLYEQGGSEARQVKIFTDGCNELSSNSIQALSKMSVPVSKMMSNSVQKVSNMKESTLPAKKRKTNQAIDSAIRANKPVSSANWALVNADIGMLLNRDEVADYRRKVGEFGLSLLLIWTPHIDTTKGNQYVHVELDKILTSINRTVVHGNKNILSSEHGKGRKRLSRYPFRYRSLKADKHKHGIGFANGLVELSKNQENDDEDEEGYDVTDEDVYQVVLEASHDGAITVGGDRCRQGTKCDYQGETYKWCYTDWDDHWGKCCVDDCLKFSFKDYPVCRVNPNETTGNVPCSIRSSMIAVSGRCCLQDHPCGLHGQEYHWCYTSITGDMDKRWDYCCQPWHSCSEYGESYKWCYVGKNARTTWKKCFY